MSRLVVHQPQPQPQPSNPNLKVAADKLSYYDLAGTLSKLNYAFRRQETEFIAYMRERYQMQGRNKPNSFVDEMLWKKVTPLSVATLSGASQRNSKSVDLYELTEESPAKTLSRGLFLSISRLISTAMNEEMPHCRPLRAHGRSGLGLFITLMHPEDMEMNGFIGGKLKW
ncbi:hypothetical protein FCULG_00002026 [Fusarium culmorum]|uniref:Uncharacterized protein n=1 Tax=Fusarium culmorum TaxID=5516 RepID=A0A2T4GKY4_FUSCU|nr:hypothetical protein FCULG_00002026 [Fusarium culmorum]